MGAAESCKKIYGYAHAESDVSNHCFICGMLGGGGGGVYSLKIDIAVFLLLAGHRHSMENLYFLKHIIKCINYNSVKFQVDRLQNKKVTIYRSALSYKICSLREVMKLGIFYGNSSHVLC